ncbi:hypothetical protein Btru_037108 [Bulinus truncatus]|nr:hypothetical protein Btru_037108 [Bulinus truncatus]
MWLTFNTKLWYISVLHTKVVLSIFAFATTTSHDSSTTIEIQCDNETSSITDRTFSYSYPYDLESVCFKPCEDDKNPICLLSGSKSSAEFYVFVGVIVFLYCLAALVIYIFFDDLYRRNTRLVIVDFVISVLLTLLWIISSSAWAAGVSDVKTYTDPDEGNIFQNIPQCGKYPCKVKSLGNFASLNVSLIFGFLNFGVWVGNLWFIYKETPWFKLRSKPPTEPGQHSPITGNTY